MSRNQRPSPARIQLITLRRKSCRRVWVEQIVSRGNRRRPLASPSFDRVQISHLVGSHSHVLHAVSIVVLKFVMIIVVALAKCKQRHQKRVARAASCRVRLTLAGMAGGVKRECSM